MKINGRNSELVLLIGAMKAGTTTLADYLTLHKDICGSVVKEPEYFSETMTHGIEVDRYEKLWPNFSNERYALDSSTGYTRYPREKNVAKQIYEFGGSPKFIYLVRDPFKRIESHQNFMRRYIDYDLSPLHPDVLETSNYYVQLQQYLKYFPKKQFLLLEFENLIKSPQEALNLISEFLEIDKFVDVPVIHNNQTIYPTKAEMFIKSLPAFRKIRGSIPESLSVLAKKLLSKSSESQKFDLSVSELESIRKHLQPSMELLRKEFSIDTRKWGF